MYVPKFYDQVNLIEGTHTPSGMKGRNNFSFSYFERALFQRALSVIKIGGLPETLPQGAKDFLLYCLFKYGYAIWFSLPEYGVSFQPGGLSGYNLYYQPTRALITNPALPQSLDLTIGKDCELLKLTPDFSGVWDIITFYADKLSLLDSALNQSLINSRWAYLLYAKNKSAATALKKMVDKINTGEPAVILDETVIKDQLSKDGEAPFELISRQDVKNGYLTTDLLQDYRTLLYDFDSEIGIPTMPAEKKERMITAEAEGKTLDAISRSTIWVDCLKESGEKVNQMFGLNLTFALNFDEREGGTPDGEGDDLGDDQPV